MSELVSFFNNLVSSQQSAYFAGLIAAFTPCTLAIFPIFLYRFGIWDLDPHHGKKSIKYLFKDLAMLAGGFLFSFAIAGLFLQNLLASDFVNVTRLVLGFSFVLIGILQFSGKLSFQFIAKLSHPLLIGLAAPWIISLSPCVLPYFAGLVVTATAGDTIFKFVLFGAGILTPALILSFVGNRALAAMKKFTKALAKIERWSSLLIIFAGIYISSELLQLTTKDVIIAGVLLLVEIGVVGWRILRIPQQQTGQNYSLLSALIIVALCAIVYLAGEAGANTTLHGIQLMNSCGTAAPACNVCRDASIIFNVIIVGLAITNLLSTRPGKRIRFSM